MHIERLEKHIEETGLLGISGAIFVEHTTPKGILRKPNTTVRDYCENSGACHNITGEDYAEELMNMINAPSVRIVAECDKCFAFLDEDEIKTHTCISKGTQTIEEILEECNVHRK